MVTPEFVTIWFVWLLVGGSPVPATMGIAAALGLSVIMLANAWLLEIVHHAGALYLGWLAIKALRRASMPEDADLGNLFSRSLGTLFLKGSAVHLTNPKAILSWASICTIIAPSDATPLMLFGYFGLLFAGSVLFFSGYGYLFSPAPAVRTYARARRGFDLISSRFFEFTSSKMLTVRLQ